MGKRTDIHKVLIIGSCPIIIGQACEFDYSGTQACKALRNLGYEIVLVNSNPATIMTDPATADVTYIEPLNVERLEQIIAKERPDALLPNLGGQSGLNLCSELANAGIHWSKDWTFIGNANSVLENDEYASRLMYMYNKPRDKDNANTDIKENISKPLFTKVHLSNEITADNTTKRLPEFNIKVTAYAVQAEGVSVEEAKNSLLEMSIVRED